MGSLFDEDILGERRDPRHLPAHLLHQLGCLGCPLNSEVLHHPKMVATGSTKPAVLILGEGPGEDEDKQGKQFVGKGGQLLRKHIPPAWLDRLRWNNVVNCRPPSSQTPTPLETECCRPRIITDVERTKPRAIFGFGNVPLAWCLGESTISNWRGRYVPVKIGSHVCWYFPFTHPASVLRSRSSFGESEDEHFFRVDMARAFQLVDQLPPPRVHTREEAQAGIDTNIAPDHLVRLLRQVSQVDDLVGVDFETNCLRPYAQDATILTIGISSAIATFAFPFQHPGHVWSVGAFDTVATAFLEFLASPVRKVSHNLAFEQEWIAVLFGRDLLRKSPWEDSMSQAFVLDQRLGAGASSDEEGELGCYGLGFLSLLNFGLDIKKFAGVDRKNILSVPLPKLLQYNAVDARYHRLLFQAQAETIAREKLSTVYASHLRRVPTCVLTQVKGLPLDAARVSSLAVEYDARLEKMMAAFEARPEPKAFFQRVGKRFNPDSNPDMTIMCRDILGSKAGQTEKGYSVDVSVLKKIKHPLTELVLARRAITKLRSTYIFTPDRGLVWPDGLLHPQFNTMRARTARLSSSEPNGQNIPVRTEEGRKIRQQIAAREGHTFLSLDYSSIEARMFAMASRDAQYVKLIWEDFDIHADWGRRIAMEYPSCIGGKPFLSDVGVMAEWREKVKGGWVFAKFFGARNKRCSAAIGVPIPVLDRLEPKFWAMFPNVKKWQERTRQFYTKYGYVEMLTGRRRCGPMEFNAVINTPIQGTAGEIVMDGMNRLSELEVWELQPDAQLHDDLRFEIPANRVDEYAEIILKEMLRPTFDFINVPLATKMKVGPNWYDMETAGTYRTDDFFKGEIHG